MHLESSQLSDVLLCHCPSLCAIWKGSLYHCSEDMYFGGLALILASEDLAPQNLIYSACLLHSHCHLHLNPCCLPHLTTKIRKRLNLCAL